MGFLDKLFGKKDTPPKQETPPAQNIIKEVPLNPVTSPAEVLNEPQKYKNVSEFTRDGVNYRIMAGDYPVPEYKTYPYVYFPFNPNGQIFHELQEICSKATPEITVRRRGDEYSEWDTLLEISARYYMGNPELLEKKAYGINPDGTMKEEFGDYVIRPFQLNYSTKYDASALSGTPDAHEYILQDSAETVKRLVKQHLSAINKKYYCFPSAIIQIPPRIWTSEKNGTIGTVTYLEFSIIYPASKEPTPQRMGPYNPNRPKVDYGKLINSLAPSVKGQSDTIGITDQKCPYCSSDLPRFPKKKMACPACKQPIYPRLRYQDNTNVLLTEDELKIYEKERFFYKSGGMEPRIKHLINSLNVCQLGSDRWRLPRTSDDDDDSEIGKFVDRYFLIGSKEEIEIIQLLLMPENMNYSPAEVRMVKEE